LTCTDGADVRVEVRGTEQQATGKFLDNGKVKAHLYTVLEMTKLLQNAGCEIMEVASMPTIINSLDEGKYHEEAKWKQLEALELNVCTEPELLGIGSQLLFVAKKV
jgi:hypothetical protein